MCTDTKRCCTRNLPEKLLSLSSGSLRNSKVDLQKVVFYVNLLSRFNVVRMF